MIFADESLFWDIYMQKVEERERRLCAYRKPGFEQDNTLHAFRAVAQAS